MHTLGIIPDKVSFTSDYFDQIEKLGVKIIELGKAYCDDTLVEEVGSLVVFLTLDEKGTYGRHRK